MSDDADICRFAREHPDVLTALTARERRVWEARYGMTRKTNVAIAAEEGVSAVRIGQIHSAARSKLFRAMRETVHACRARNGRGWT